MQYFLTLHDQVNFDVYAKDFLGLVVTVYLTHFTVAENI